MKYVFMMNLISYRSLILDHSIIRILSQVL